MCVCVWPCARTRKCDKNKIWKFLIVITIQYKTHCIRKLSCDVQFESKIKWKKNTIYGIPSISLSHNRLGLVVLLFLVFSCVCIYFHMCSSCFWSATDRISTHPHKHTDETITIKLCLFLRISILFDAKSEKGSVVTFEIRLKTHINFENKSLYWWYDDGSGGGGGAVLLFASPSFHTDKQSVYKH